MNWSIGISGGIGCNGIIGWALGRSSVMSSEDVTTVIVAVADSEIDGSFF